MKSNTKFRIVSCLCLPAILICLLLPVSNVSARMITQILPTLTITEEYNDNYFQTGTDTFEEWITSYELGFSVGFLNKKSQVYLEYNPEYRDFKNMDDRDSLDHNASLSGTFQPTKYTTARANIAYDGHDGNNEGDSWQHSAGASIESQLTKTINIFFSHDYSNSFDQQVRTGDYKEHETHTTQAGIHKLFGEKNRMGLDFAYEKDNYKNSDADEYTNYEPSAFMQYWMTPKDGIEANAEFEKKEFEVNSDDDYETIAGDIRYIRKFTRHLDGYVKYRHYLSDRSDGDHQVFHPSVGVDWDVTEDSGISIGVGILFHEWDNENDDSEDIFFDIDAYKVFNFSPRGSLSITGSSKYEESDEEAASLGYNISYQAGFSLNYLLTKQLSSSLFGSYQIQDFQEQNVDRQDDTVEIGGGLTWTPLKWLQIGANASHTNFNSDGLQRDDYEENKITFYVKFIPEKPIRPDKTVSRKSLEKEIFD
ncbi:MAG: outer membrane beta-barrel protein [Desulfobacter sp.]|nr:MAG: outer membrane beta-barrel protein [Desulfobacter sp.]